MTRLRTLAGRGLALAVVAAFLYQLAVHMINAAQ